jgi:hypothetical protein
MAIDSHTVTSPWRSTGTLPAGDHRAMFAAVSGWRSGITTSSKAAPACFSASHGRSDHDE